MADTVYRIKQIRTKVSADFIIMMDLCKKNLMSNAEVLYLYSVSKIKKGDDANFINEFPPPLTEMKETKVWSSAFESRKEQIIKLTFRLFNF